MTIGGINGKGINGTTNEYLTIKFNGTGTNGNMTNIGRSKTLGALEILSPDRTPRDNIKRYGNNTSHNRLSRNMKDPIKGVIRKKMSGMMEGVTKKVMEKNMERESSRRGVPREKLDIIRQAI
ncbi:MAG: hypothetical protein K9N10_14105 [Deltaproteobacteria bacterium]|nr:hypothetical protein [Deltaproteobacteria bacterium]